MSTVIRAQAKGSKRFFVLGALFALTLACSSGSPATASGGSTSSTGGTANNGGVSAMEGGTSTTPRGGSTTADGGTSTAQGGTSSAAGGNVNAAGAGANAGSNAQSGGLGGAGAGGSGGVAGAATSGAGGTPTQEEYPIPSPRPADETGAELWLRYRLVPLPGRLAEYKAALKNVVGASSATLDVAKAELIRGLGGLTGQTIMAATDVDAGSVVIGTASSESIKGLPLAAKLAALGAEGYVVEATSANGKPIIAVAGNTDVGVLYGAFALLRHLQSHQPLTGLALSGAPKIKNRVLDHWDNLDGTVERGYAGSSIWKWGELPATISPKYKDYARANASLGINGAVLTNVNANAQVLKADYLAKVKAIADTLRPYGIKVYLTANFKAPTSIGGLTTADPLDSAVKKWWSDKADEIYALIPDFGGFVVKANSEGQPGPQEYNRTHADGANTLADAVGSRGIVMWRAFVYSTMASDRIRQAYDEFHPLDGKFKSNVLVQVKNGPLDFQPREPFHPLFGAMPGTGLALELQITKEYLGEDTHLAYLGPLYEEVLRSVVNGQGATVAKVVDGELENHPISAIAGVSNIGSDTNWTGSHFNQANWYVFGRMAWDPTLSAASAADEWVRQTFSNDPLVLSTVVDIMMHSRESLVNYMTPLGLAHIMGTDHHYGPAPWVSNLSTPEWNPVYYHHADNTGIGFDRTSKGSGAITQYATPIAETYGDRSKVPEELLLFFHRVAWSDKLKSGRSVWEELVHRYSQGVDDVGTWRDSWMKVENRIDAQRFKAVADFLQIQHYEARWWRDACLAYFSKQSGLAIPAGYAAPAKSLSEYQSLNCPADAKKPRCPAVYTGTPSPAILSAAKP